MPGPTIDVYVIDDHPLVGGGVEVLLRDEADIRVVGAAATVRVALAQLPTLCPDVVLLDMRMPAGLGSEAVADLRRAAPRTRIVVFTAYPEHPAIDNALAAGARGALLKDAGTGDLVAGIRRIAAGEVVVDPRLDPWTTSDRLRSALDRGGLTDREYDVLRQVALGHTNPEIAETLGIARSTVKAYLQSCMQKLGARNRIEAISRASEQHLL